MKRGFKAKAERRAVELRKRLDLAEVDPMPARRLAHHLGYMVARPSGIGALPDQVAEWMSCEDCGWSACLMSGDGVRLILYNPSESEGRQESSLMHELAHVVCGHPSTAIDLRGGLSLRQFVDEHEEEASWLGGCLQIPRVALARQVGRRRTPEQAAEHFTASLDMVWYRYRMTGLARQFNGRGW